MLVNEYEVTEKRYIQWTYESRKEGKKLFFLIFWSVFTLVCLGMSALSHDYLFVIVALYCLYRAVIRDYVLAKTFYRKSLSDHGGKWNRRITVSQDDIVIADGKVTVNYKSSDIIRSSQNDERIRLHMKDNNSIRLYNDSFVEGNIEEYQDILKL